MKRLEQRLLDKVRASKDRRQRTGRAWALDWDGKTYGYGPGRAAPCVEFTTCPICHQPPGKLCLGAYGVFWGTHWHRRSEYRKLVRAAREKLEFGA